MDDREVVAMMAAGSPQGIAAAYDNYAASLYGYCHWMLGRPTEAAEALRDAFVAAATASDDLPEAPELRPWLYSLARRECLRHPRTRPIGNDGETEATLQPEETVQKDMAGGETIEASGQVRAVSLPDETTELPIDATMPIPVVSLPNDATQQPVDATMYFRAVSLPDDATQQPVDATMYFRAVSLPDETTGLPIDATMPIPVVSLANDATQQPIDATMRFRAVYQPFNAGDRLIDSTQPFRAIYEPIAVTSKPKQTDLPTLVGAILAGLKPREREVVELSLRHNLHDADLAMALGMSPSRAHSLSARAHGRLKRALEALLIARTGREACPELDALLADWDGQLTPQARDLIEGHVEQCETCSDHRLGELRSAALSGLMPMALLPPQLRDQVLKLCSSNAPDAVAYRRRITHRTESVWPRRLWQMTRLIGLGGIRRARRPTTATVVLAAWVILTLATSTTLLVLTSARPSRALATSPSGGPLSSSPVAAATAASTPATFSPPASPPLSPSASPTFSQAEVIVPPPAETSSATARPSPSSSRSPKLSKSPSPKPSKSPSPSPSSSPSPSPSPSASTTS
jgi:RNA polymerase sigma factor (sigma-70 family)